MEKLKLKDCCQIIAGQSPQSRYYNTDGVGLPFFQGKADFGDLYPSINTYCSKPIKIAEKDDILLSVRAPVGPTNLSPEKVCIGRGLSAIRPDERVNLKYLLHYFRYYQAQLELKGTGTTFNAITQDIIKNIEIPIPSLGDQECIVDRIEELFSELDKGLETLMTIKKQLKVYRQAVLKEAFSQIDNKKKIGEMSCFVTSGSRGWAKYYSDQGSLFIRIGNLTRTTIDIKFDEPQYVKLPEKAEGIRSRLQPNDILVSITADLGSIGLVPENIDEAYINQHIAMIRLKNPSQGKLVAWYLRSEYGQKDLLKNKRGGGKLGLGLDDIRNSEVPNISEFEADLIVKKIEMQLSVCDRISQIINTAFGQAESMRKSILKQAFEGRLINE